jgi:hypothetical protein
MEDFLGYNPNPPKREKIMKVHVPSSDLDYGHNGVSKKRALQEYSTGYMEGVNKKAKTVYKEVQKIQFTSGTISINRKVKR